MRNHAAVTSVRSIRLQNAYALLAYYLETKEPFPAGFSIDKIINQRDEYLLGDEWKYTFISDICNSIGNLVVLDIPKRYNSILEKVDYYKISKSETVRRIFESGEFTYDNWKERNSRLKELLAEFFTNPVKND